MPAEDKSQITGVDAASRDAGFDNFYHFLLSYNLRIEYSKDVKEGRAILRSMGYGVSE
jgi:hypothetical protein